jgi:hypothetical protein
LRALHDPALAPESLVVQAIERILKRGEEHRRKSLPSQAAARYAECIPSLSSRARSAAASGLPVVNSLSP